MNFFHTNGKIGPSERDAVSLPSLEEAWLYLEAKGILTEKCCVKMPTGHYVFSGADDRRYAERKALYGDRVYFMRSTKTYMLKFDRNS